MKITEPENRDQAIALYNISRKWRVPPHEYVFGTDLDIQDKLDIDFVINYIGTEFEAEQLENAEKGDT